MNRSRAAVTLPRKRAYSYLRVSTTKQADKDYDSEGFSLPSQRQLNDRKAEELNADIVGEFIDRGGSGRNINRKDLQRMLAALKEDGQVDYVIVSYIDRFARRLQDHVLIKLAIEKAGAHLVSATENIDGTDAGQLVEGVLAVVAEFQSNHNVGKVKTAMQRKADAGGTPGRAPIGYRNVEELYEGRPVRTVILDDKSAPHIKWAFEVYATGEWTLTRLTDELNNRGLRSLPHGKLPIRPLSRSNVAFMLSNPYYYGVVRYKGTVNRNGRHPKLITRALYDKVQEVLHSHACGEKQVTHLHHLKSAVWCGYCGDRMGFSVNKGAGGTYHYWLCLGKQKRRSLTCEQRYVPDTKIEDAIVAYWQRVRIPDDKLTELQAGLRAYLELVRNEGQGKITELRARIGKLRAEEKDNLSLFHEGSLTRETFKEEQARIGAGIAQAEADIARLELADDDYDGLYSQACDLLRNFGLLYRLAPPAVRRQCNRAIFANLYFQGPTITGARLTKTGAGLLHDGLVTTWGRVPDAGVGRAESDSDGPTEDEGGEGWAGDAAQDSDVRARDLVSVGASSRETVLVPPA